MTRRGVMFVAGCWLAGAIDAASGVGAAESQVPANFSGAVLVARGDTIILQRAYGLADASIHEPNTPGTVFRIGSLTKAITAAAVLILADEDKIRLHDPIASRWPGWPKAWSAITAHHLLLHTAAIEDFTVRPDFPAAWLPEVTAAMLIARFGGQPGARHPAASPHYSNSHYILLGELVARAAGQGFDEVVQSRLLNPAVMTHTRLLHAGDDRGGWAIGYTGDTSTWQPVEELPPDLLNAAGAAASTVGDLFRFVRALEAGHGLLSEPGRELLWTAHHGNRGYGWTAARVADETVWLCLGQVRGFSAAMLRAPQSNLMAVVLANRDDTPCLQIGFNLLEFARRQKP